MKRKLVTLDKKAADPSSDLSFDEFDFEEKLNLTEKQNVVDDLHFESDLKVTRFVDFVTSSGEKSGHEKVETLKVEN